MKKNTILINVALASLLSIGMSGCSSDSDSASTSTDVTVERGKVYGATVQDSSSPVQTATQKANQNVYTFENAPIYPITATGGWIDVNDDGIMDSGDVQLDVTMTSYSNIITPITTYIADADEEVRNTKLEELRDAMNADDVGHDVAVTSEDLLGLPSEGLEDVIIVTNAIYANMKTYTSMDSAQVMNSFAEYETILDGYTVSDTDFAKELEAAVMIQLGSLIENVTADQIAVYGEISTILDTTLLNLNAYEFIYIFKGIDSPTLESFETSYANFGSFTSEATASTTSCSDFGFLDATVSEINEVVTSTYISNSERVCFEIDYSNATYGSGTSNIIMYWNY